MKAFGIIKRIIIHACLINTVLVFAVAALANVFSKEGLAPKFSTVAMILVFSLCIGAAGYILSVRKISGIFRVLIHYFSLALAFYMIFVVWGGFADRSSTTLIAMVLFTIIYAVAMVVYFIVKKRSDKRADDSEYESRF